MYIDTNNKLVRRNARIGQITMLAGLLVLGAGMYYSFQSPENYIISLIALFVGFILSQIGMYFSNRWGRLPRPYEQLNQALKGLDKNYALFNYTKGSPASHLLVGPAGVWVLMPRFQGGTITYSNGRWRQRGGNWYLKLFGQESLGRVDLELQGEVEKVTDWLNSQVFDSEEDTTPVYAALIFTNPKVKLDISPDENPPAYTITLKELKDTVRKVAKDKDARLAPEKYTRIQDTLKSNASDAGQDTEIQTD